MQVLTSPQEMMRWRKSQLGTVGFVPTMGALHEGHAELIRQSVNDNDSTVLSIFVNSAQFNEQQDFDAYPRTFAADSALAQTLNVDAIYAPTPESMYPHGLVVTVEPGVASVPMEGLSRPGHFRGVATIVVKLLNAVEPTYAYFGRKDFQQLAVVQEVVRELNMSTNIVGVPTVRDHDGLALSSRNVRLTQAHRAKADIIWRSLQAGLREFSQGERRSSHITNVVEEHLSAESECHIEYVSLCDAQSLVTQPTIVSNSVICVAVRFGDVRLIDNIELTI